MKRKNIIVIIFLLVVVALIFYRSYFSDSKPRPDFTITITEEGFSSDPIKIAKGTRVIFVNKGTSPHWPASDFHPTHGIYPEFDPLKGINFGEEWSLVFKPGKWHYHDHLYPNFTGIVEVEK